MTYVSESAVSTLKSLLEQATRLPTGEEKLRFNIKPLTQAIFSIAPDLAGMYENLKTKTSARFAEKVFQGLVRNSFLIEYVRVRGGSTRMGVRWNEDRI